MKQGKCPHCLSEGPLTKDHIIPVLLFKILGFYGINMPSGGKGNIQWLCEKCNVKKRHIIPKSHRKYAQMLKATLYKKIELEGGYMTAKFVRQLREMFK